MTRDFSETQKLTGRVYDPSWRVPFDDVEDSYRLAMQTEGIETAAIKRILSVVEDYVSHEYGED